MNNIIPEKLLSLFKAEDYTVMVENGCYEFNKFSPAGQDFMFMVDNPKDLKDLATQITEIHNSYDVSEETMLWLDSSGHGKNGAPYDMKDVYDDMTACEAIILRAAFIIYEYLDSKKK